MMHIAAYDIADDRRRAKVAEILSGYGCRVQESVFECRLNSTGLRELTQRLAAVVDTDSGDSVRVYRLCADCAAASLTLSKARQARKAESCTIV